MANFMFDAIARNAIAEFGEDASINVKAEPQTIKFIIGGRVVARHDDTLLWSYEIRAGEASEVIPLFPTSPVEGEGSSAGDLVKAKVIQPWADSEESE